MKIKRLLSYIRKDRILLIITIVLNLISVFLTILLPFLFGKGIDLIIGYHNVNLKELSKILTYTILSVSVTAICQYFIAFINSIISYRLMYKLRIDLFKKIQELPIKYLDTHPHGSILSTMINDVEQIGDGIVLIFNQLISGIFTILGTIVFMFYINWFIGLIVVLLTPLSIVVAQIITKRTYKYFSEASLERGRITSYINEHVENIKFIQQENYTQESIKGFDEIDAKFKVASFKAVFYSSLTNPVTRFINSLIYVAVALIGTIFIINGSIGQHITLGVIVSLLSYANQYSKPFNDITQVLSEIQNALACSERVFNLLNENSEEYYKCINLVDKLDGKITFEEVEFSYDDSKLIEHFNLDINPGDHIAIVGKTGSGKTTLINLLMRFYNIKSGNICLDKYELNSLDKHSFRSKIGMVLQDSWIRSGTVRENITLGKNISDEKLIKVCKMCYADEFISKMKDGYDTYIISDSQLSQGEKQLISIARIMLLDPDILILDEATSSIDTITEQKIQKSFDRLMANKTSIIVAHRLSTIKDADKILVLERGNIVESGKHEELLKLNRKYSEIYYSQFINSNK